MKGLSQRPDFDFDVVGARGVRKVGIIPIERNFSMKSAKELVAEANARVKTIRMEDAVPLVSDSQTVFVDLRDSAELQRDGKIPGAVHVNRGMLEFVIDPAMPYHNPVFSSKKKVIFYCASGGRSALAADTAQQMGLEQVAHLGGGFKAWCEAGGAVEKQS
jgi:rhodanese-related sulfurtransferase